MLVEHAIDLRLGHAEVEPAHALELLDRRLDAAVLAGRELANQQVGSIVAAAKAGQVADVDPAAQGRFGFDARGDVLDQRFGPVADPAARAVANQDLKALAGHERGDLARSGGGSQGTRITGSSKRSEKSVS